MSRTIGHTKRQSSGGMKRGYKDITNIRMRARTKVLIRAVMLGEIDSEAIVWPKDNECGNWWDFD